VHLADFPDLPTAWQDEPLATRWEAIRAMRRDITQALEAERAAGRIRGSLEAQVTLAFETTDTFLPAEEWATLGIVSHAVLQRGSGLPFAVTAERAKGRKCARCWRVLEEVGGVATHPALCLRCTDAVESGLVARAA
jgi:isoleucyl-tRNA synthetase